MILFTATIVEVFLSKPESSETLLLDVHSKHLMYEVFCFWQQLPKGHDLLIHEVSRSHTTTQRNR